MQNFAELLSRPSEENFMDLNFMPVLQWHHTHFHLMSTIACTNYYNVQGATLKFFFFFFLMVADLSAKEQILYHVKISIYMIIIMIWGWNRVTDKQEM